MLLIGPAGKVHLRLSTCLLWACLALCLANSLPSRAHGAPLGDAIGKHASAQGFSGTIFVSRAGSTLYRRGFGMADRAFAVPAGPETRYPVASITKLFTSVLILQLAQEGRIDLDSPFGTYLPDYPGSGSDAITVHHLLNHTSGLGQFDNVPSYREAFANGVEQYQRPLSPEAAIRRCCSGPPARGPGAEFVYNNSDYLVLGQIVARVTGGSYEKALSERILRPLGMSSSGMLRWDKLVDRLAPTYFIRPDTGVLINDMPVYYENWSAAAGMYSSAADLDRFSSALFGGKLIGPAQMKRLLAPGLDEYGYGLWSYSFRRGGREHRVAKRPGSIMGANAVLYRLLDEDVTILILANTNRVDLDVFAQKIAEWLVDGSAAAAGKRRTARPGHGKAGS